jgi:hypothetical protein
MRMRRAGRRTGAPNWSWSKGDVSAEVMSDKTL